MKPDKIAKGIIIGIGALLGALGGIASGKEAYKGVTVVKDKCKDIEKG